MLFERPRFKRVVQYKPKIENLLFKFKFNTIFSKLIGIFVLIILVAFLVTGVMLYYFLGNFVLNERISVLKESANQIDANFRAYIRSMQEAQKYINPLNREFAISMANQSFDRIISLYSLYTNSYIWIISNEGYIYKSVPELPDEIKIMLADDSGNLRLKDERQYKKILSGQQNLLIETGNFYGFFKNAVFKKQGESWLTLQKAIRYPAEGSIIAAVYLHTPVPEIQKMRNSVLNFFAKAVLAAVIISAIMMYIFSRRLTKPLVEMKHAAKVIASGDFKKRINVKSNDEIGALASSFNQMVSSLENLEEMRRSFIANVSHELRTPMTSIRGFIEGILDGTIPPGRQNYYLNIVKEETNRLSNLVNDLLDLARMESGELKLNFEPFDINESLRKCIIKLESLISQKGLEVEPYFEEEEIIVSADKDSIDRVIINLLHNAIKFTPNGGVIRIYSSKKGSKAEITIEDTGIGIEPWELSMIWDRFYKSDKSRSKDRSGTGLGLAIVKNIIHEHGQNIEVYSRVKEGTRFTFTLDLYDPESRQRV